MQRYHYFFIISMILSSSSFALIPSSVSAQTATPNSTVPDEIGEIIKVASAQYKQKKYDEALISCQKAAAVNPRDPRPLFCAGTVYSAQKKYDLASQELARSIALDSQNKITLFVKADVDNLRGAKEEALAGCRAALKIDPSFAEAYLLIGEILIADVNRRDEAVSAYRSALASEPRAAFVIEREANGLRATDETATVELFKLLVEADPKHMHTRFDLGRLLVKLGRLKEARLLWEESPSREDRSMPNFIVVLERAENLKNAEEALAAKPNDPDTLLSAGLAMMEGDSWVVDGRQERALVHFKKALEIKPNYVPAQAAICKAFIQIADTYKAKEKNVDEEIAKLRTLDSKLADEMAEYRKTYAGGLRIMAAPGIVKQN